jgi:hypothetical protein
MQYIILIILFILLLIVSLINNNNKTEGFLIDPIDNTRYNTSRVYPGIFSGLPRPTRYYPLRNGYPLTRISILRNGYQDVPINLRYMAGYRDYWYIPAHEQMKSWMYSSQDWNPPNLMPYKEGETCISERMADGNDFYNASDMCRFPGPISENYMY